MIQKQGNFNEPKRSHLVYAMSSPFRELKAYVVIDKFKFRQLEYYKARRKLCITDIGQNADKFIDIAKLL